MANDDALKRKRVDPTHKKKKRFQPLLLKWGPFVVDTVFRRGSKYSNYGDTVIKMLEHIVSLIRKKHSVDVPIILKQDSGFYDQKNFKTFEKLGIGYICGGKIYATIHEYVGNCPVGQGTHIEEKNQE